MIAITGASGQLGRLVMEALLQKPSSGPLVAVVRNPERIRDFAARGVQVRQADYDRPETLAAAFDGVNRLLLISSNEVGRRVAQHGAVIDAAKRAGVTLLAYTSILRADTSPMGIAAEHKETEKLLQASGIPFVLLRNGWYTENYTASIPAALAHGAFLGSAGDGRIASAARADYAVAAAKVVTGQGQAGRVYELAGDTAYSLAELAEEISRQSGQSVAYRDLPEVEFRAVLVAAGLPEGIAGMLAESDVGASKGGLFDDGRQLSRLIGRPTTPLAESVKAAIG